MEAPRPQRRYRFVIAAFILLTVLLLREHLQAFSVTIYQSQIASVSETKQSFFCAAFGWLLTPLGFREDPSEDAVGDPLAEEPGTPAAPKTEPDEAETASSPAEAPPHLPATTTTQIIRETPTYITNEYITTPIEQQTIREVIIRDNRIDSTRFVTQAEYDGVVTLTEGDGGQRH